MDVSILSFCVVINVWLWQTYCKYLSILTSGSHTGFICISFINYLTNSSPFLASSPPSAPRSSIVNVPGESTLRRDFIRLQQENKERSEALRRQQLLQEQQLREQEEYKRQLLAERQKRIEQQKEQRRRLEEVSTRMTRMSRTTSQNGECTQSRL